MIGRPCTVSPPAGSFAVPATVSEAIVADGSTGAPGPLAACAAARGESAAQQSPGPNTSTNGWPATPRTYLMSENPGGGGTRECVLMPEFEAGANATCVSGSYPPPGQFVPPPRLPMLSEPRS